MVPMFRRVVVLAAGALLLFSAPAQAATRAVTIGNDFFSPTPTTVAMGDTVRWTNSASTRTHTTTGNGPLSLWNETMSPGEVFPLDFDRAGTFAYHCTIHGSMDGVVKVPVRVSPASGGLNTIFTIRIATAAAPGGFRYVVQRRKGSGPWRAFRTTTSRQVTFDPASTGTFSFRSKLQRISNGASSGYSPARSVTVH